MDKEKGTEGARYLFNLFEEHHKSEDYIDLCKKEFEIDLMIRHLYSKYPTKVQIFEFIDLFGDEAEEFIEKILKKHGDKRDWEWFSEDLETGGYSYMDEVKDITLGDLGVFSYFNYPEDD